MVSEVSGVYFVTDNTGEPLRNKSSQLITLNKDVAVKVPFIAPILQSDQWTKTKPDNNGRIAITLLSHPLLTLNALISLCKQLQSLTKEEKVAVQVSNENELWLADYMSIPVRINLLDVDEFLAVLNLSQTETFQRIKENEDVKLLWQSMFWHWCYYGATLTTEQMKLVPIGFIEEYLEQLESQPNGLRCAFMIQPFEKLTLCALDQSMHNPSLDIVNVLMTLAKSRPYDNDIKSIQKLFDSLLKLNFVSHPLQRFLDQNKEFTLKYCSRSFLGRCLFYDDSSLGSPILSLTIALSVRQISANKLFLALRPGIFELNFNSDGLLYSIDSPVTVILYHPCFTRYIMKQNDGDSERLVYMITEEDLATFRQYPSFPIILIFVRK